MPFPTAQRYIDGLPRGIDSYPSAVVKGSVVRGVLGTDLGQAVATAAGLPFCVVDLARDPPPIAAWIPETYYVAALTTLYDIHFSQPGGLDAMDAWAYEGNKKLLRSPLYRVMFLVISPERVLVGAEKRWAAFHRGSVLRVVELGKHSASLRLTYPPRLMTEVVLRGHCTSFRAAGEAAGARLMRVRCEPESDSAAMYELQWA